MSCECCPSELSGYLNFNDLPWGDVQGDWVSVWTEYQDDSFAHWSGYAVRSDGTLWAFGNVAAGTARIYRGIWDSADMGNHDSLLANGWYSHANSGTFGGLSATEGFSRGNFVQIGSDSNWSKVNGNLLLKQDGSLWSIGTVENGESGTGVVGEFGGDGFSKNFYSTISSSVKSVELYAAYPSNGSAGVAEFFSKPSLSIAAFEGTSGSLSSEQGSGSGAVLEAEWHGRVVSIVVSNGGGGLASAPAVSILPSCEEDAGKTATAVVSEMTDGYVSKIDMTFNPAIWTQPPLVSVSGGVTAYVTSICGPVTSVSVTSGGSGYTTCGSWLWDHKDYNDEDLPYLQSLYENFGGRQRILIAVADDGRAVGVVRLNGSPVASVSEIGSPVGTYLSAQSNGRVAVFFPKAGTASAYAEATAAGVTLLSAGDSYEYEPFPWVVSGDRALPVLVNSSKQWISIDGSSGRKMAVDSDGMLWWWGTVPRGTYVSYATVPERVGQGAVVDVDIDSEVGIYGGTPSAISDSMTISGISISPPDNGTLQATAGTLTGRLKKGSLVSPWTGAKWGFFRKQWVDVGLGYTSIPTVTLPVSAAGLSVTARLVGPKTFTHVHRGKARDADGAWWMIADYFNSIGWSGYNSPNGETPFYVDDFETKYTYGFNRVPQSISRTLTASNLVSPVYTSFSRTGSRQYGDFTVTKQASIKALGSSVTAKETTTQRNKATAYAVMNGNYVSSIVVTDGGDSYVDGPSEVLVYLNGSPAATQTAFGGYAFSVNITNGVITSVTTNFIPPQQFFSTPTVSFFSFTPTDIVTSVTVSEKLETAGTATGTHANSCNETFPDLAIFDSVAALSAGRTEIDYTVSPIRFRYLNASYAWDVDYRYSSRIAGTFGYYSWWSTPTADGFARNPAICDPYKTYGIARSFSHLKTNSISLSSVGTEAVERDIFHSPDPSPFLRLSQPGMLYASGVFSEYSPASFVSAAGGVFSFTGMRNELAKPLVSFDDWLARDSFGNMWSGSTVLGFGMSTGQGGVTPVCKSPCSVSLSSTGTGYTQFPSVHIEQPPTVASLRAAGMSGSIVAIGVVDGGSGYRTAPYVQTAGNASAFAVISGPVDSVSVTSGGSGYRTPPKVVFSKPGVPATATASIDATGRVVEVSLVSGGEYRSAPSVSFEPETDIESISITNGGYGFTSIPSVLIVGGGGGGGAAVASVQDGRVVSVSLKHRGSGYKFAPRVLFIGGGGSAASAVATVAAVGGGATAEATINGSILYVRATDSGSGYTNVPLISVEGTARLQASVEYSVGSVVVDSPGDFYNASSTIYTDRNGFNVPSKVVGVNSTATVLSTSSRRGSGIASVSAPSGWFGRRPAIAMSNGAIADVTMCMRRFDVSLLSGNHPTAWDANNLSPSGNLSAYPFFVSGSGAVVGLGGASTAGYLMYSYLYSSPPSITIDDITGTGASVSVSNTGSVSVVNGGSGYTLAGTATASGGRLKSWDDPATAVAVMQFGVVAQVNVTAGGSGYLSPPRIIISGGGGVGATAVAVLGAELSTYRSVVAIEITSGGVGYSTTPTVTIIETHTLEDAADWFTKYNRRTVALSQVTPEYCRLIGPIEQRTFSHSGEPSAFVMPAAGGWTYVNHYSDGFVEQVTISHPKVPYTQNPEITIDPPDLPGGQQATATAERITYTNTYCDGFPIRQT